MAEIVNTFQVCKETSLKDIVMNYIALGIISEIDDLYYNSLQNSPLKEAVSNPPAITRTSKSWSFFERPFMQMITRIIYKILRFLYVVVYFYLMPLITVVLSRLSFFLQSQPLVENPYAPSH